jgi:diguanylate cyclase (GGDEF)-like protein
MRGKWSWPVEWRGIALDIALFATVALMVVTDQTVLFFHIVFVILALEAFFRAFWGFVARLTVGVAAVAIVVYGAVIAGTTQADELIEIPLLTAIIVTVFMIAGQRKRSEDRLAHLAMHDSLTGLANRTQLRDRLALAVERYRTQGQPFALLFVDLDDFKNVNDSGGHATGDALLTEVARRLERSVRTSDLVARMGGDEFAILLQDVESASRAHEIAARFVELMTKPFAIDGNQLTASASVGVVDGDGSDMRELLRRADVAMYAAKAAGKSGFVVAPVTPSAQ